MSEKKLPEDQLAAIRDAFPDLPEDFTAKADPRDAEIARLKLEINRLRQRMKNNR